MEHNTDMSKKSKRSKHKGAFDESSKNKSIVGNEQVEEDSDCFRGKTPVDFEKRKVQKTASGPIEKRKRITGRIEKGEQSGPQSPVTQGEVTLNSIHLGQQRLFSRLYQMNRELELSSESQEKMTKKINSIYRLLKTKDEQARLTTEIERISAELHLAEKRHSSMKKMVQKIVTKIGWNDSVETDSE